MEHTGRHTSEKRYAGRQPPIPDIYQCVFFNAITLTYYFNDYVSLFYQNNILDENRTRYTLNKRFVFPRLRLLWSIDNLQSYFKSIYIISSRYPCAIIISCTAQIFILFRIRPNYFSDVFILYYF